MSKAIDNLNKRVDTFAADVANERPLIGISANRKDGMSCINEPYFRSVLLAGGAPVLISVFTDIEALTAVVETLDGLIFSGGGDIDASYLDEDPLPELDCVDPLRDEYDLTLLRLAFNRRIPILGVCRGHQLINVAFGGSLYQDIKTQYGAVLNHSQDEPRECPTHTVEITMPDSRLSKIFAGIKHLNVNSLHHQAVHSVAPGFIETAVASDGINEAIEHPEYQIISIQWHPEQMADKGGDEAQLKLFRYLVGEAATFKRIKAIHSRIISLDSHVDTPLFFSSGYDLGKRNDLNVEPAVVGQKGAEKIDYAVKVDVPKMREGLCDAICMVAYRPQGELTDEASQKAVNEAIEIVKSIKLQIKRNEAVAAQAVTAEDVRRNKADGKKSVLIGIENGYAIGKDINNLALFERMGVVYITLSHNGDNDICDAAVQSNCTHNGLSAFGREIVLEMNRLGIMIDLSHTSEKTSFDVLEISAKPVIASHSSCKALCDHPRNISDHLMKAIAAKGGVIQVCLYDRFLRPEGKATVQDLVDHIDYVVNTVGIDYVGIGSDFDGCDDSAGLRGINEFPCITAELLRRGYSEPAIAKIWGGNFLRVMEHNTPLAIKNPSHYNPEK